MHILNAISNPDEEAYLIPVPVKYVLEKGYRFVDGFVVVEAPYNRNTGLDIGFDYDEYKYGPEAVNYTFR